MEIWGLNCPFSITREIFQWRTRTSTQLQTLELQFDLPTICAVVKVAQKFSEWPTSDWSTLRSTMRGNLPLSLPGWLGPRGWITQRLRIGPNISVKKIKWNDTSWYSAVLINSCLVQLSAAELHQQLFKTDAETCQSGSLHSSLHIW